MVNPVREGQQRMERLTEGMFVYLCSGEVRSFPTATTSELSIDDLYLFAGSLLIEAIPRRTVWSASRAEGSPVPS